MIAVALLGLVAAMFFPLWWADKNNRMLKTQVKVYTGFWCIDSGGPLFSDCGYTKEEAFAQAEKAPVFKRIYKEYKFQEVR